MTALQTTFIAAWTLAQCCGAQALSTNHLAREKSPYLILHAHNPVDWYPWGPAAFAEVKAAYEAQRRAARRAEADEDR